MSDPRVTVTWNVDVDLHALEELRDRLRAEVERASAILEGGGGAERPFFSLDGVLCARCDGFGHDAPDCPENATTAPAAPTRRRRSRTSRSDR